MSGMRIPTDFDYLTANAAISKIKNWTLGNRSSLGFIQFLDMALSFALSLTSIYWQCILVISVKWSTFC